MQEQERIIEVEVEASSVDDVKRSEKGERIRGDHRASIRFFGILSNRFMAFCVPLFFIFLGLGLAFSILYSENPENYVRLGLMIAFWSLDLTALVGIFLAFLFRFIMRSLKKRDPNFEESVKYDDIYE